jgi:hypothetical protein
MTGKKQQRPTATAASRERLRTDERSGREGKSRKREAGSCRRVALLSKGDDGGDKPPKSAGWRVQRQSRIREEPAVEQGITFVGLDAHKDSISVAMLLPGATAVLEWQLTNEPGAVKRMVRKVERQSPGDVRFCYEAGPCGYALQRQITQSGEASCMVVAPSLIPVKPGERVKTEPEGCAQAGGALSRGPAHGGAGAPSGGLEDTGDG